VLYKTCTPVDDRHTLFCQFIARSDHPDEDRQQGIIAIDRQVQEPGQGREPHARMGQMRVAVTQIRAERHKDPLS